MERLQGLLGIVAILGLLILFSRARKQINWRTLGVGLALQVLLSLLVLKWSVGFNAMKSVSKGLQKLTDFTNEGTSFVFGSLFGTENSFVFALNVLPVIIFLGAIIGALYYFRVIQFFVDIVGGALKWLLGTSKVESVWASTVIFLGQSEAPLVIQSYLKKLTRSELFTCMTGGFASVAGSTLIGYSLLGAPLEYLLAASVMNARALFLWLRPLCQRQRNQLLTRMFGMSATRRVKTLWTPSVGVP
ncbi:Nucleoside transporter [Corynebacterium ulcerans]|uniref:Nucleoside transporter n=1 Tax=Corynebacterium ulcerans TaxID=65058 RepID=A0ABD7MV47_CORUL|nr:Nucleoside transporter [Corynebacterium ulcerans]SQG52966.1 Nucleoside transporter [Corynebacterium ulcerans]SQH03149.1 Nucleoside transporter [Corynebacterium ulcerans]